MVPYEVYQPYQGLKSPLQDAQRVPHGDSILVRSMFLYEAHVLPFRRPEIQFRLPEAPGTLRALGCIQALTIFKVRLHPSGRLGLDASGLFRTTPIAEAGCPLLTGRLEDLLRPGFFSPVCSSASDHQRVRSAPCQVSRTPQQDTLFGPA